MRQADPLAQWRANPFFVLELKANASRADVERAAQRLLGLLAIGAHGAGEYPTPFGPARRDADTIRQALGRLRDPLHRVTCELWASVATVNVASGAESDTAAPPLPTAWEDGARSLGWGQP